MDCFFSGPTQFAFETLGPSATHCQCVLQLLLTLKPCFSVSCRATGLWSDLALPKSAGITSINLDPIFRKAAFLRGFLHGKRAVSGAEPQHAPFISVLQQNSRARASPDSQGRYHLPISFFDPQNSTSTLQIPSVIIYPAVPFQIK